MGSNFFKLPVVIGSKFVGAMLPAQKTMEHFGSLSPELIALAKEALVKPN